MIEPNGRMIDEIGNLKKKKIVCEINISQQQEILKTFLHFKEKKSFFFVQVKNALDIFQVYKFSAAILNFAAILRCKETKFTYIF
jgi:transcription initiation factor TFIID subunit TAF12